MAGYSEEFGKLKIKEIQVEGWIEGVYNTYVTYCDKTLAIKYHRHATDRERHKVDQAAVLYNLTNGLDIIGRCDLYKVLLEDIVHLQVKMAMKIQNGLIYNFDVEFVFNSLKETVNVVHNDIQDIYTNLKYEAFSQGRQFSIPLPDYTIQNITENYTEHTKNNDIVIKNNWQNETLELIKKDTDFIIELIKELKAEKDKAQIIPKYINELVKHGYIGTDGRTALTSLDDIAEFLYSLKLDNFNFKVLLQFCQHNGKPFSENTAKEAAKRASRTK